MGVVKNLIRGVRDAKRISRELAEARDVGSSEGEAIAAARAAARARQGLPPEDAEAARRAAEQAAANAAAVAGARGDGLRATVSAVRDAKRRDPAGNDPG